MRALLTNEGLIELRRLEAAGAAPQPCPLLIAEELCHWGFAEPRAGGIRVTDQGCIHVRGIDSWHRRGEFYLNPR